MKRTFFFTVFFAFFIVWGFSQADMVAVAIVNLTGSQPISMRELRTEVDRFERRSGQTLSDDQRRQVLDTMINERLLLQAAERDRVRVTDNELNQQMQQLRNALSQQLGRQPTEAEFAQAVRNESGLEIPAFREQMQRQMVMEKYIMAQKQSLFENIRVPSEAEITGIFNLTRSQFTRPDTVRFSMLQVPYGSDAAARTRARELADRLAREIGTSAARFNETLARAEAANSGYQRDEGFLPRDMEAAQVVGQEFMNTAFSLRPVQISGVMEGRQGFQIIMITEYHGMRNLELNDVAILGTNITVREIIGQQLLMRQQQEVVMQATQEVFAELRSAGSFQIIERNLRW